MISRAPGHPLAALITAFRHLGQTLRVRPGLRQQARRRASLGHVVLLGAGPGAADLITVRGLQALKAADVVFYDRLSDPALLEQVRPGVRLVSVGKAPGAHSMSQDQINAALVQAARQGLRVVRLKCGDPGIFGRGAEEAQALDAAGIGWSVIPGVTAACAAAASAGSFLTERGVTERVILATGHRRAGDTTDWARCAVPGTTLVCYMGVASAGRIQTELLAAGWPGDCPVEVVSQAQTERQRLMRGSLLDLSGLCAGHPDLNPAILFIRWPSGTSQALGGMPFDVGTRV